MYSSAAIANRFLVTADDEGADLTPMKIQKLVYIAHGWHLAYKEEPLCLEVVQAWRWGPVFHDLYHSVKRWGRQPITSPIQDYWDGEIYSVEDDDVPNGDVHFGAELIDAVWGVYGSFNAAKLSAITHAEGTPWSSIYDENRRYAEIPNELIRDYYKSLLAERKEK